MVFMDRFKDALVTHEVAKTLPGNQWPLQVKAEMVGKTSNPTIPRWRVDPSNIGSAASNHPHY